MVEQERIPYRKVGGRLLFDADEMLSSRGHNLVTRVNAMTQNSAVA
jgi:hypothetical protein